MFSDKQALVSDKNHTENCLFNSDKNLDKIFVRQKSLTVFHTHFYLDISSKSYHYSDCVTVDASSYILVGWYASMNHMIYSYTGTAAA